MNGQARQSQKRKGFTLVEIAIVLGVMGLVMGTVWTVVGTVWESQQILRTKEQVLLTVQNVRGYFTNAKKIGCATDDDITSFLDDDDRRLFPIEMRADPSSEGGDINHALASKSGGSLKVYCLSSGRSFRVVLSELKRAPCMRFVMDFPVLLPELGISGVLKPDGSVVPVNLLDIASPADGYPMTLATAESWCSGETNEVGFDFNVRK